MMDMIKSMIVKNEIIKMGSYELNKDRTELHYTGDSWTYVKITEQEAEDFDNSNKCGFDLFNDGRFVFDNQLKQKVN